MPELTKPPRLPVGDYQIQFARLPGPTRSTPSGRDSQQNSDCRFPRLRPHRDSPPRITTLTAWSVAQLHRRANYPRGNGPSRRLWVNQLERKSSPWLRIRRTKDEHTSKDLSERLSFGYSLGRCASCVRNDPGLRETQRARLRRPRAGDFETIRRKIACTAGE